MLGGYGLLFFSDALRTYKFFTILSLLHPSLKRLCFLQETSPKGWGCGLRQLNLEEVLGPSAASKISVLRRPYVMAKRKSGTTLPFFFRQVAACINGMAISSCICFRLIFFLFNKECRVGSPVWSASDLGLL